MISKKFYLIFFVSFLSLGYFASAFLSHETDDYPYFKDNPYLDDRMRTLMAPYLLPLNHPLMPKLDALFSKGRIIETEETLLAAGFSIIESMPGSFITVAKHSDFPGYVFKLYLDSETRCKKEIPNWEWLTRRCIGADILRKFIKKNKIRYFTVPDKWLYLLPPPSSTGPNPQPVIVVATDMEVESKEKTAFAWKTCVTKEHLDELFSIVKHGYGTVGLTRNILYTKSGTFSFVDTEYPIRRLNLKRVRTYLSEEMQSYWDILIEKKSHYGRRVY